METAPRYDVIAGYRLIRKLGAGDRSEVFLGHALDGQVPPSNRASGVAVKVFHAHVAADSIDREIRARTTVGGDGLAALLDLTTMPDGRVCVVLERLDGSSLPAVLAHRDCIEPGEAVTILAPVIVTVAGLHRAGLVMTSLTQAAVQVTATGRPVLTSLGGLREVTATQNDLIRDDYGRLTVLMRSVFDHLDRDGASGRRAEATVAWFEMAVTRLPFQPCLDELERRLFEWSPAAPVGVNHKSTAVREGAVPARISTASESHGGSTVSQAPTGFSHRHRTGRVTTRHHEQGGDVGGRLGVRIAEMRPMTVAHSFLRSLFGPRRRSIIVAGCVAAAIVVLALTFLPPGGGASQADPPHGVPSAPASAESGGTVPTPDVSTHDTEAIIGDEPVAAAAALLRSRALCLSGGSIECLETVDQEGSAALATDRYQHQYDRSADELESNQESQVPAIGDPDGYTLSLVERTGDSALVALEPGSPSDGKEVRSEPASLLVVKGEAGWRIREIFGY